MSSKFENLLINLYSKTSKPIVILIDEYEKPVLDNITDQAKAKEMREILRGFYSVLKDYTGMIRFLLITGLTKFTKMGVFSALNNLNDISFDEKYSQMLGYTDEEIVTYFDDYINQSLSILTKYDRETLLREIKNYYDGFKFDGIHDVYNPFAVLLFFDKTKFLPYWSESGSPAFLYEYLKTRNVKREDIVDKYITEDMFSNYEIEDNPPELFLAQAGYLIPVLATPKELGKPMYKLEIPNLDIEMGLEKILVSTKYKIDLNKVSNNAAMMIQAVELEDIQLMKKVMQKHLSEVNYEVWSQIESMGDRKILENEYQWLIASLFKMAGYKTSVEYHTSKGRIDILVETNGKVFIIELKVDESGKKALEQIKEKGYAEQFKFRKVYMIGIGISSKKRNIVDWEVEIVR